MNANEQNIVQKILAQFRENRRVNAAIARQSKNDAERDRAEIELILDDLVQEGIPPDSVEGQVIAVAIFQARRRTRSRRDSYCDSEGFPTGDEL